MIEATFFLLLAAASLVVLLLVIVIGGTQMRIARRRLNKYQFIYRIISVPSDQQFAIIATGASIEVGDYGWEAEPIASDGLIYLHGLNPRWQVVWYAGFRPDQVEVAGPKPRSQYYIFPYWVNPETVPQCPFPVKNHAFGKYPDSHLGFPAKIEGEWVQGRTIRTDKSSPAG